MTEFDFNELEPEDTVFKDKYTCIQNSEDSITITCTPGYVKFHVYRSQKSASAAMSANYSVVEVTELQALLDHLQENAKKHRVAKMEKLLLT